MHQAHGTTSVQSFDPSLYLVFDPNFCRDQGRNCNRNPFDLLVEAVQGGVTMIQLRDKTGAANDVLRLAKQIVRFLQPKQIPLIINDRPELVKESGAAGVHLGKDDMHPERARELLGRDFIIGQSIETTFADKVSPYVDYIGASPVFSTSSKPDTLPAFGLDGLKKLRLQVGIPIVGIGGMQASNVAAVMATGIDGIAVISAILSATNPEAATQELREKITTARKHRYANT